MATPLGPLHPPSIPAHIPAHILSHCMDERPLPYTLPPSWTIVSMRLSMTTIRLPIPADDREMAIVDEPASRNLYAPA
jgi:hypothetical protein